MKIDTNTINISDGQLRDLMIYYAITYKDFDFGTLYKNLYPEAFSSEWSRVAYFIRLALGLNPDNRNLY